MKLSRYFSLEEFLVSQTAERHGIDMTPSQDVIDNLQTLVSTCLQPLRDALGNVIYISSGYRPVEVNRLIGGSATSQHVYGNAADFSVVGMTPFEVCNAVVNMELPFDQIILEFPPNGWVHLGVSNILRAQQLTAYRTGGKVRYINGINQHAIRDSVF